MFAVKNISHRLARHRSRKTTVLIGGPLSPRCEKWKIKTVRSPATRFMNFRLYTIMTLITSFQLITNVRDEKGKREDKMVPQRTREDLRDTDSREMRLPFLPRRCRCCCCCRYIVGNMTSRPRLPRDVIPLVSSRVSSRGEIAR